MALKVDINCTLGGIRNDRINYSEHGVSQPIQTLRHKYIFKPPLKCKTKMVNKKNNTHASENRGESY